jgi:predicted amidohydrolase
VPVTVAACQVLVDVERPTTRHVVEAVTEAADRGARLVVLPELAVAGYCFSSPEEARAAAEDLDGPTMSLLRDLSAARGLVVVAGLPESGDDGHVHNTAVVVDRGRLVGSYRKVHLWGEEPRFFRAGTRPPLVVDTSVGRVGVMVCYDLEFPEWVRLAAQQGAEILAVPVNWPRLRPGRRADASDVLRARAAATTYRVNLVVADRCGVERGVDWVGASLVCGPDGTLLAGPHEDPDDVASPVVLVAEVEPALARDKRLGPHNDALRDRRPELYGEVGA